MEFITYKQYREATIEQNYDEISACEFCNEDAITECPDCEYGSDVCMCCGHEVDCELCQGTGKVDCVECNEKFMFSLCWYHQQKKKDFAKINAKCRTCTYNERDHYSRCSSCADFGGKKYVSMTKAVNNG